MSDHITQCRLCPKKFSGPPFLQNDAARLAKLFDAVSKHMQEAHKDYLMGAVIAGYTTDDPVLQQIAEAGRAHVHNTTRKNFAPDTTVQDKLAAQGFNEGEIIRVLPILQDLRDFLTEQGQHAPQTLAVPA